MDENAGNDYAAEKPGGWVNLRPGQQVRVNEPGHAPGVGVIDNMTSDGSVVWVWVDGKSRRMFVAGDPVALLPGQGNLSAF